MIVLVAGLPGSGKSYFATRLAAKIGAIHINSDKVRTAIDALGKYSLQDKITVYIEMVKMTSRCLNEGRAVVVDATFYKQSMRSLLFKLAETHSSKVCLIHVTANEPLIKERLSKPRPDSEADFGVYEQLRDQFQEITTPHLELESRNDNITSMLDKAIDYIRSVHAGK
jgi:predicted kinase